QHVRQGGAGGLGVPRGPVVIPGGEVRLHLDVRVLLLEQLDRLVVPLGPVIVAPPVQAQRDLLVRIDGLATTWLTAGAAAGAGSQGQRRSTRRGDEGEAAGRSPARGRGCHLHSLSARPMSTAHWA